MWSAGTDVSITSTGINYAAAPTPGWVSNMRLTVVGSGFKVVSDDGTDLSATNPGFVTVQSQATPGRLVRLKFTANPLITGANMLGRMGTTASVAWASARPVYFGVANVDDTSANARFCHSHCPLPCWSQTVTNEIGRAGTAAVTSAQDNVVIWDATATVADYNSVPITTLGSATMTCDNSAGGVWTVGALTIKDGFGQFQEGVSFTMPVSQNGATAGKYLADNAGTAPTFTTNNYFYWVHRDGRVSLSFYFDGNTGTDGAGAVTTVLAPPLSCSTATWAVSSSATISTTGGGALAAVVYPDLNNLTSIVIRLSNLNYVQNGNFADGNRTVWGGLTYPAF